MVYQQQQYNYMSLSGQIKYINTTINSSNFPIMSIEPF